MNFLGVFGHVVVDYILKVPRFPRPNASIGISSQERFYGGTGANLARMASRLGVMTSLASFVGHDFPRDFFNALKSDGIDLSDLRIVRGYPTPTCYVFTDGKNQLNFIDQGPMKDAEEFEVLEHTVESSQFIHIGTGRPEYYEKVTTLAKDLGKDVGFDPGQEIHYVYTPRSFRKILGSAKYLFCNQDELKRALKFLRLKRAREILKHVDVLVLTRGEKGSQIYSNEGIISIPAVKPRRLVDTTGAGDAYRAGFYAALSRDSDLNLCGLAGAVASSFVIESVGAQTKMPTWKAVKARLRAYSQYLKD